MRDIDATIKQARSLGSGQRLMISEVDAIRSRAVKGYGKIDIFSLICDAYDFGFMLGFRMGKKNSPPDDLIDQVSCFQENGFK